MTLNLLTGGTGFVGSFLGVELIRRGNFVIFLARGKGNSSPRHRIDLALSFVSPSLHESLVPFYRVMEADITKTDLGLSADDQEYLKTVGPSRIYNCAGSVEFDDKKSNGTRLINVEGVKNLLAFASRSNIHHVDQISTLYVAGDRKGDILETDLFKGQAFNNVYEETKAQAEQLIHAWAAETRSSFSIYRLPIVIGDSRDGKTPTFTGFYGFFKPFVELKSIIQKKAKRDPCLSEAGISAEDGFVTAPLFVKCSNNSRIDLVPIDWIVENISLISERKGLQNLTFHLSHPCAPTSREIIEQSLPILGLLGFKGISASRGGVKDHKLRHQHKILNSYQRIIDSITERYFAYNTNEKHFLNSNLVRVLAGEYNPPPEISKDILKAELGYAVRHRFHERSLT